MIVNLTFIGIALEMDVIALNLLKLTKWVVTK